MHRLSIHDFHARLTRGDGSLPAAYAALGRRAPADAGATFADWPVWNVPDGDGIAARTADGWIPWGVAARAAGRGDWTAPPAAVRAG